MRQEKAQAVCDAGGAVAELDEARRGRTRLEGDREVAGVRLLERENSGDDRCEAICQVSRNGLRMRENDLSEDTDGAVDCANVGCALPCPGLR